MALCLTARWVLPKRAVCEQLFASVVRLLRLLGRLARGSLCCRGACGRVSQKAGEDLAVQNRYGWPEDFGDRLVVAHVCGQREAFRFGLEEQARGEVPGA